MRGVSVKIYFSQKVKHHIDNVASVDNFPFYCFPNQRNSPQNRKKKIP